MTSDIHAAGPVDQGEWLQTRPGERCLIRVAAAETNGAYSVVEIFSHPSDSTPIHVHQNEDECFGRYRARRARRRDIRRSGRYDRRASEAHFGRRQANESLRGTNPRARRRWSMGISVFG